MRPYEFVCAGCGCRVAWFDYPAERDLCAGCTFLSDMESVMPEAEVAELRQMMLKRGVIGDDDAS